MIKGIIFDFDGTISNRYRNAYNVFKDYAKDIFKDFNEMQYEAMLQDFLTDDCNGTIKVSYRLAPFINKYKAYLPENFEEKFTEFYYEYMWKYCALRDETLEVLKKLHGQYKLVIFSNGQSKSQHDKIDSLNVNDYFDDIIVSDDIGMKKPDACALQYAAKKMNLSCDECLMVGDVFSSDILGAINAGIKPVWICQDIDRPSDFYKGYKIRNLNELFEILEKENHQ